VTPDIFQQIGLSEPELKKYLRKLRKFYTGLNNVEQRVLMASLGTKEEAMRSFHPNLTAEELQRFLERVEGGQSIVFKIHGTITGPHPPAPPEPPK